MSNADIITELTNINTRLDRGINMRGVRASKSTVNVLATVDDNNRLNVNATVTGTVELNNKTASVLVYGKNGSSNVPVSVESNGKVNVTDTDSHSILTSINSKLTSSASKLQVQDVAGNNILNTINSTLTHTRIGSHNNIYSGNLIQNASSTAFDISSYHKSVLSYCDTSHTLNNTLQIIASVDGSNYDYIGLIIPITNSDTSKRYASTVLELSPFTSLKIINFSADTVNGITCSLYGSG